MNKKKQRANSDNSEAKVSSGFSDRLNAACDAAGIPPKNRGRQMRLAEIGDVTQGAARKWVEEDAIPRTPVLRKLAEALHVKEEWLVSGLGEMRSTPHMDIDTELLQGVIEQVDQNIAAEHITLSRARYSRLIAMFYQQAAEAGRVDPEAIARTFKMVIAFGS